MAISAADAYRSAGCLASARPMIATNDGDTAAFFSRMSGGGAVRQAMATSAKLPPGERPLAAQQFVEHDAGGKQVAACVDRLAAALLGRHVARRADHRAGLRQVGAYLAAKCRNPSSSPVRSASSRMFAGFTSRCTMPRPCAQASASSIWPMIATACGGWKPARLRQHLAEIAAVDIFHRQERIPLVHREVVDRDDVRMRAAAGGLRLVTGSGRDSRRGPRRSADRRGSA